MQIFSLRTVFKKIKIFWNFLKYLIILWGTHPCLLDQTLHIYINLHSSLSDVRITSTKDVFLNMSEYGDPRTKIELSRLGFTSKEVESRKNKEKEEK